VNTNQHGTQMNLKLGLFPMALVALSACNTNPNATSSEQTSSLASDTSVSLGAQAVSAAKVYSAPEANGLGKMAWSGGKMAWSGGKMAWSGGKMAWSGADTSVTLAENYDAWKQVHLDVAQGLAKNLGAGVKVAVIDTGVDYTHTAFVGRLAPRSEWRDFVDNDNDPQEVGVGGVDAGFGHGTGVAGVIAQVAPKAMILPLRALNKNGAGDTTAIANAIRYAVSAGAKVINLSLGTVGFDCDLQKTLAINVPDGVFVVASAGNSGTTQMTFPAATTKQSPNAYYANDPATMVQVKACGISPSQSAGVPNRTVGVGSVGAINFDRKSAFSTYGGGMEIMAPGEGISTALPGGLLGSWSGTSFAAPMVSGAIALAAAETPKTPSWMLAKFVVNQADLIDGMNPGLSGKLGFGRLNIERFLKATIVY
jgi:thermitase